MSGLAEVVNRRAIYLLPVAVGEKHPRRRLPVSHQQRLQLRLREEACHRPGCPVRVGGGGLGEGFEGVAAEGGIYIYINICIYM